MPATRLAALDGLRGIAAMIVLVHHSVLVVPGLAAPYFGREVQEGTVALLVDTPLHLFWAGTEAVYLFFILSGVVLGFSVHSRSFSWTSYFPSRIARLYLPVIGAVALGALVIALTPDASPDDSAWIQNRPTDYDITGILHDIVLIGGTSGSISPLWSLQWEVLFSLMLPLFIYVARRLNGWIQLPLFIALSTLGAWAGVASLKYLPMFGIGIAMAALWDSFSSAVARLPRRVSPFVNLLSLVAAVLMITSYWTVRRFLPAGVAEYATLPVVLIGIIVILVLAAHAPLLSRVLSSPPLQFLGLISFSLYLIHEPIVVAVSQVVERPALAVLIAIPVALAVGVLFWRTVERPSHRISRSIRNSVDLDVREHAAARPTRPVGRPHDELVSPGAPARTAVLWSRPRRAVPRRRP